MSRSLSRGCLMQGLSVFLAGSMVALPVVLRADELPDAAPPSDLGTTDAAPQPDVPPPPPPGTPSGTTLPQAPPATIDLTAPAPAPATVAPLATKPLAQTNHVYRRPRVSLLSAGLALFVAGWMADVGFTYGYDHPPGWTSIIPVAGPFIQMTERYGLDGPPVNTGNPAADARITKNIDTADSTIRGLAIAGETLSALFQLTGLALTIAGAVLKRRIPVYATGGMPGIRF